MITRPFTCCCAVLAIASGFFLYTKKHQTTLLDQQISALVHETEHVRTQTAMLRTEWALENQPERLAQLASHHAPYLRTMDPAQFVRLSDLEEHLPAVDVNAPARAPVAPAPARTDSVAMATAPVAPPARPVAVANTHPAPAPVMVAETHPAPQVAQPHMLRLNTETPRAVRPAPAAPHAEPAYTTVATTTPAPSAPRANTAGHDAPGLQRTSTDHHTQVAALTPRPLIHKQDTAALDTATSTPDTHVSSTSALAHAAAPASHHTTLVADDSAPQQVRHPLPMAAASWHSTRTRHTDAIGRGYMEARATSGYTGGSLLSRGDSILPPPVPVTN